MSGLSGVPSATSSPVFSRGCESGRATAALPWVAEQLLTASAAFERATQWTGRDYRRARPHRPRPA